MGVVSIPSPWTWWQNLGWRLFAILNYIKCLGWTVRPLTLKKDVLSWFNLPLIRTKLVWCSHHGCWPIHIILGRSWLHDLDVTIYGRSNFCLFVYDWKKVKLASIWHVPSPDTKRPDTSRSKKTLNLISMKSLDKDSLENLLRCLVGVNLMNWDLILPTAEFAYSSMNR